MKAPNINYLWAQLLVEELFRGGVSHFAVSPGSRCAPLITAAVDHPRTETVAHLDERGAAFWALGHGKATGRPAAVICTSGTASANFFPAVVEASHSRTPLLLLTADRPAELRDTGALQTIDQTRLYGNYSRWSVELPVPSRRVKPEFLLTTAAQAIYRTLRSPKGPVQINCPFPEPLDPRETEEDWGEYLEAVRDWEQADRPFVTYAAPAANPSPALLQQIAGRMDRASGILVVGPLTLPSNIAPVVEMAEKLGWPIFADVLSGIRQSGSRFVIQCVDGLLRSHEFRGRVSPDLIVRLGGPPTSKPLSQLLSSLSHVEQIIVEDHPFRSDPQHLPSLRMEADPVAFSKAIVPLLAERSPDRSSSFYFECDAAAKTVQEKALVDSEHLHEPSVARTVARETPDGFGIFLANSMPIRDFEAFCGDGKKDWLIGSNRGASGIDGTVAAAVGFGTGIRRPVTVLIGDLAFLHDLNSLALIKSASHPIILVVVNNDGGGIFSFLPIHETSSLFHPHFSTPHGLDFKSAAKMYGLEYSAPKNIRELRDNYVRQMSSDRSCLIEITGDREDNVKFHERLWRLAAEAAEAALPPR